jgi:hypothetical protein
MHGGGVTVRYLQNIFSFQLVAFFVAAIGRALFRGLGFDAGLSAWFTRIPNHSIPLVCSLVPDIGKGVRIVRTVKVPPKPFLILMEKREGGVWAFLFFFLSLSFSFFFPLS